MSLIAKPRRFAARVRVEHAFHVVKRLWGFSNVRYRALAKNTARLFTSVALANLYLLRHRLLLRSGATPRDRDENQKRQKTALLSSQRSVPYRYYRDRLLQSYGPEMWAR
jgi:predicted metal-dependent hydrolase